MITKINALLLFTVSMILLLELPMQAQAAPARYNGPGSADDVPAAMAVDGNGNIYVTGKSWGGVATGYDFATAKYSPQGSLIWVARYVGPGTDDIPTGIAVDANGNVYVTGRSKNDNWDFDYVTVRYTPLLMPNFRVWPVQFSEVPHQAWVQRYDNGWDDKAVAIAVFSGRVYVTGSSWTNAGSEYATLAYDASTGDPLWDQARRYDADGAGDTAVAIAVNSFGEIFVTGYGSLAVSQILTLRYTAGGAGPLVATADGVPKALKVRGSSVYVAGWTSSQNTGLDIVTIKYNRQLEEQWHDVVDVVGSADHPRGLAIDSLGRVYVAGGFIGNHGEFWNDYIVLRYTSNGTQDAFWVYDGTPNADGNDIATAIAIDASDNVYVTGYSAGQNGQGYDFVTMKLNGFGFFQWTQRFTSDGQQHDQPTAMAVDANGNVYVTGSSPSAGQGQDFVTVKYSSAGAVLW